MTTSFQNLGQVTPGIYQRQDPTTDTYFILSRRGDVYVASDGPVHQRLSPNV